MSPLSLLKLFTVTVGYILHHIVLGLNVSSVRGFTQMGGVFLYILFLKLPCSRLLYLLNEKKKSKPNKTNQLKTIEYEDTYPTVYESYMA